MADIRVATETPINDRAAPPAGATTNESVPLWGRVLMPSVADLFFCLTFYSLTFGTWAPRLLDDADTGWHIRNGEHILASHAVPHADYFSYTMFGRPWFAWEWLYDVVVGGIHRVAGLNGVVVLSGFLVAVAVTLLFQLTFRRSGNLPLSVVLTLTTAAAASIHVLARPHLVTWVFVLVWFAVLDRFQADGGWKRLIWLPGLMLLWVNFHGGFLLGLVLPGIYAVANLFNAAVTSSAEARTDQVKAAKWLGITSICILLATFVNPYGWHLYGHLRQYLGSRFMMSNINEFQSPDFHFIQAKLFAALVLLVIVGFSTARKVKVVDVFLAAFSIASGLYAARNIPIACMLLTLINAPLLSNLVEQAATGEFPARLRNVAASFEEFSNRMGLLERQLRLHLLPLLLTISVLAIALNGGRLSSAQLMKMGFEGRRMPVGAVNYLEANHISNGVFSEDGWGGYLIYRLHPAFRVFVDDRHDFYGENFLTDYMDVVRARPRWKDVLNTHSVKYVMISPESALSAVLRVDGEWHQVYADSTAVIYAR